MNDDIVIQCGPIFADNFTGMQALAEIIKDHAGVSGTFEGLRVKKLLSEEHPTYSAEKLNGSQTNCASRQMERGWHLRSVFRRA